MTVTLAEAIEDYEKLRLIRLAQNTRDGHSAELNRFYQWATRETQPRVPLDCIDDRMMSRYFTRLLPPGHAPSTYNTYRQYHRAFWDFCRGEDWIRTNPMRHVDPLRVPVRERLQLSADELLGILDRAEPRDRIALALGMNTGLRAGDVSNLSIGSANLSNMLLSTPIQKTGTHELLPITTELRVELLRWMEHYAASFGLALSELPNDWTLVPPIQNVNTRGCATDATSRMRENRYEPDKKLVHMERIVHKALAEIGLDRKGEGFHTLRRSTLRVMFDLAAADGIEDPIRIPQAQAGHRHRQTTEHYLGITHEKRIRDDMLRGQSYLTRAVNLERRGGNEGGVSVAV